VIVQLYPDRAQTIVAAIVDGAIGECKIGQIPMTGPDGRPVMEVVPDEKGEPKQVPRMQKVLDPENGNVVLTHVLIGWLRVVGGLLEVQYQTQPQGQLVAITLAPTDVMHVQKPVPPSRIIT